MAKISDLPDELLVKILSFLPTKVAVSTSILPKQWEILWMFLPNLEFDYIDEASVRDFINKNLPLLRAPVINSLCFRFISRKGRSFRDESLVVQSSRSWVQIAVSRGVRELSMCDYDCFYEEHTWSSLVLPIDLFTCSSLVTLKLEGDMIFVHVPQTMFLPSLKTLQLKSVVYSEQDSLRLLLSSCPVLEDLVIERHRKDHLNALVIIIPSLQRLSLIRKYASSSGGCMIKTPSLKYFKVVDCTRDNSYLIEPMSELEEADISVFTDDKIDVEKLLRSITTVKSLSIRVYCNSGNEIVYGDGIVFNQLENLKLYKRGEDWSNILFQLLNYSPNLQILEILDEEPSDEDDSAPPVSWSNNQKVPTCLSKSLKTFKFEGYCGKREHGDFLSFIFKHARCLESTSILHG